MGWFKRLKEGITTSTKSKKEAPDGLWAKCKQCQTLNLTKELKQNYWICSNCDFHFRIDADEYMSILFDAKNNTELFGDLESLDYLNFEDLKTYEDRLKKAKDKSGLKEAITVREGKVNKFPLVIAAMDFSFIGGSMGAVVGEKISRAVDHCIEHSIPLMVISKSGGARMMESAFSLMQMAKTSAKLNLLAKKRIPYLSFLTDPTTGGVSASYAMLGDVNFAEPGALIGFAGPRVIKETIKQELPEGFQKSEYLLEHGFLDFIVDRRELKNKVGDILSIFVKQL
jgi:acetyl-CoA carboxylase carboxyl transferase subunit beta